MAEVFERPIQLPPDVEFDECTEYSKETIRTWLSEGVEDENKLQVALNIIDQYRVQKVKREAKTAKPEPEHKVDKSVIQAMHNAGIGEKCIVHALLLTEHETQVKNVLKEDGPEATLRVLRFFLGNIACDNNDEFESNRVLAVEMEDCLLSFSLPWKGGSGRSDRNAMRAHVETFRASGKLNWQLSIRDGAKMASCSERTFQQATKRLIERRYLVRHTTGSLEDMRASSYSFGYKWMAIVKSYTITSSSSKKPHSTGNKKRPTTHNLFSSTFLGAPGEMVWLDLSKHEKSTVMEISRRTKLSHVTVRTKLAAMRDKYEMVDGDGKHFWVKPEVDLDEISKRVGADKVAENRQERFDKGRKCVNEKRAKRPQRTDEAKPKRFCRAHKASR